MADYQAWAGLGRGLSGGVDAFQAAKAAKAAAMRQSSQDAMVKDTYERTKAESTPSFDAPAGLAVPPGVKFTRGEVVKGAEKLAEFQGKHQEQDALRKQNQADKASQQGISKANQFRDEFNQLSKTYQTVVPSYGNIRTNAALGDDKATGASDMSLIFAYMKLLDPSSTVREGEYANAAKSGTFGDDVRNAMQRFDTGQKLTAEQRQHFANAALGVYKNANQVQGQHVSRYTDLAKRAGVNPTDVIYDYGSQYNDDLKEGAQLPWMPKVGPQPGMIEDGHRFKGGDPRNQANWEPVQ